MKISLLIATLILVAGGLLGLRRHQQLQIFTTKLGELEVKATNLNIPTGPTINFDSDRIRSENLRKKQKESMAVLAQELIVSARNEEMVLSAERAERITELSLSELRLLIEMIDFDSSLDHQLKIAVSAHILHKYSETDPEAALMSAVDLMKSLGKDAPETYLVQNLLTR